MEDLKPLVGYLSEEDQEAVERGVHSAFEAHDGQKRKSGEPYIIHPVAVAMILAELKMDVHSVIAGLLHDTVEDTDRLTFVSIEEKFGPTVRRIVEGETKVSKVSSKVRAGAGSGTAERKADNAANDLQQMFLAMTEEVRVIIVKLADRLHNMRTLGHMPPHKQKSIAEETLQVFAPLAHLLGMNKVKDELEDLSFKYKEPESYAEIVRWLDELSTSQQGVVLTAQKVLTDAFEKDKFLSLLVTRIEVTPSTIGPFEVHQRMLEKNASLIDVREVAQLRIVAEMRESADGNVYGTATQMCYHVLGLVHAMWPPIPGRVKDYIATPKPNGYRSLHTTVMPVGSQGSQDIFPIELMIRTSDMDHVAEVGISAQGSVIADWHRVVTSGSTTDLSDSEVDDLVTGVNWLRSIRDWQSEFLGKLSPREFVDTITGDLLGKKVFVYTPQGEILTLPKGSTVVDYAYHIHTDVGNRMVAAKVNGSLAAPSQTLSNAEVVEIITYHGPPSIKAYQMHKQWVNNAFTRSARHKLYRYLSDFEKALERSGMDVSDLEVEDCKGDSLDDSEFFSGERELASGGTFFTNDSRNGTKVAEDPYKMKFSPEDALELEISCNDRIGMLAEVSTIIAKYGLLVLAYSGGVNEKLGQSVMRYRLSPRNSTEYQLERMCEQLISVPGIISWTCRCTTQEVPAALAGNDLSSSPDEGDTKEKETEE